MKPHIIGVLVDVDGTLLDSNEAHVLAWRAALREHGQETVGIDADSPTGTAISKLCARLFEAAFANWASAPIAR